MKQKEFKKWKKDTRKIEQEADKKFSKLANFKKEEIRDISDKFEKKVNSSFE